MPHQTDDKTVFSRLVCLCSRSAKPVILICALIFVSLALLDYFGATQTVSKALGQCKLEAGNRLVGVRMSSTDPEVEDRYGYYSKHADLIASCMEARGYQLDKYEATHFAVESMKHYKDDEVRNLVFAVNSDQAVQFENLWHRRWFWQ